MHQDQVRKLISKELQRFVKNMLHKLLITFEKSHKPSDGTAPHVFVSCACLTSASICSLLQHECFVPHPPVHLPRSGVIAELFPFGQDGAGSCAIVSATIANKTRRVLNIFFSVKVVVSKCQKPKIYVIRHWGILKNLGKTTNPPLIFA